jgi:hypothetical protein
MNLRKADRRDRERIFEREMQSKAKRKGAKAEAYPKQASPEKKAEVLKRALASLLW